MVVGCSTFFRFGRGGVGHANPLGERISEECNLKKRLWLCVPPLLLCMLDQLLTLWGQSERYWDGSYEFALEVSPPFNWLLQQHPLAFEAGIIVWILLFCLVIVTLPLRLAMTTSIAIMIGHTWGASSWLTMLVTHGYWMAIALFVATAFTITVCWEQFSRRP